ncbi:hypothetical protein DVR12_14445 [Chitinophaga silvatica]|uniref:Uncharacterized protein n=1 Tax=Chitinophaga silvatica TaxID=2282649 RepID=A0A3E1Y926_9BACT|nr:hypothetical protein [Chitinophaga silvatica]RFS21851.1 hypothetical protein DVR12_14445 [Chitinophaga silvatica]
MNFFKSLFGRKGQAYGIIEEESSDKNIEFDEDVVAYYARKAILLLESNPGSLEDEEVLDLFANNGIPEDLSPLLFIFLPITFVRCWLPKVAWLETYLERCDNGNLMRKRYRETPVFLVIMAVTKDYFSNSPTSDAVIKIGGRSAEFHAINELLLKGGKLTDIRLTESVIVW